MPFLAAALIACKAVYTPLEARGCKGLETDLIVSRGRFVVAHGPSIPPDAMDFDAFVDGLPALEIVNLDFKDKFEPIYGPLEVHAAALEKLARKAKLVVYSSPTPQRYWELRAFLRKRPLGELGWELADYTSAKSESWGIPLPWWQRLALPPFRLFSAFYARWAKPAWLIVQESTAATWKGSQRLMCWTRDPVSGPPPASCLWTQRANAR